MSDKERVVSKIVRPVPREIRIKEIDRSLEAPQRKYFVDGEEVLVRFCNGRHTIGRVVEECSHTGVPTGEYIVSYKAGRASRFFYLAD